MSIRFEQGHACVIGVGGDLPTTVNDAEGLAKILKDPERCAYPAKQVRLLTGERATRAGITSALEALAEATNSDSTVLVYFSGHGYQLAGAIKSYYLMPYGYSIQDLPDTAISGSEFTDLLREIPAKKLLVVLDCCHAGGLSDLSGFEIEKAPIPPEAQRMFAKGGGRIMIGSSKPYELSYAGKPYSAFTHALIKGLCGDGVVREDGYIRATDLAMYTSRVVSSLTNDRQHPVLDIERADNFKLSYYAGGDLQKKSLPREIVGNANIESTPGQINEQYEPARSSDRSISIGGNAQDALIISGESNTVDNSRVNQRGKYNINIGNAPHVRVGDTYESLRTPDNWQDTTEPATRANFDIEADYDDADV